MPTTSRHLSGICSRCCAVSRTQPSCRVSEVRWHSAGDASRLAALLLPQIFPIFSVVAPCHPGASPPSVHNELRRHDTGLYHPVMSHIHRLGWCAGVCVVATTITVAQERPDAPGALTAADYARAERFMTYNTTPLVLHGGVRPTWLPDDPPDRFWYRSTTEKGAEAVLIDASSGTRSACDLPACQPARSRRHGASAGDVPLRRAVARSPDGSARVHPRLEPVGPRCRDRRGNAAHHGRREGLRLRHRQRRLDAERSADSALVARLEEDRDVPAGSAQRRRDVPGQTRPSATRRSRPGSTRCPATRSSP